MLVSPGGQLCSLWVVVIVRVRPGYRLVHSGSLGSLGCALGVVGFFLGRWIHSSVTWESLGSLGVVGCVLGVVGFIRGRWVHIGAPSGLLGSFGVVRLIMVRP